MNLKGFLSGALQAAGSMLKGKAPTILTGTGLVAGVATVALVAKKAPEAKEKKDEVLKKAAEENYSKGKTVWEVTKAVVPVYKEPIATGVVAAGCIIASDVIVNKRLTEKTRDLATVTAGYYALQDKFNNYKKTADEVLGETKAKDLERKSVEHQMEKSNADENCPDECKYTNEGDKQLCYDSYIDRYFRYSMDDLRKAENRLIVRLSGSMDGKITLSDWYDEIGLKITHEQRELYDGWGWLADSLLRNHGLGLDFVPCMSPNNVPCAGIEFDQLVPLWKTREKQWF